MAGATNHTGGRKSDKLWRDALMIAVKRTAAETLEVEADPKAPMLARAAAKCAGAAAGGDLHAMREIGDRIDGKPKQQTELTAGEDGDGNAIPIGISVNFIRPAKG